MSNVKSVNITGTVPFCWLQEATDADAALVARLTGPSMGLKLTYSADFHMVDNPTGNGRTAMYEFTLVGTEAVAIAALQRFEALVTSSGGHTTRRVVKDLEA